MVRGESPPSRERLHVAPWRIAEAVAGPRTCPDAGNGASRLTTNPTGEPQHDAPLRTNQRGERWPSMERWSSVQTSPNSFPT